MAASMWAALIVRDRLGEPADDGQTINYHLRGIYQRPSRGERGRVVGRDDRVGRQQPACSLIDFASSCEIADDLD